jgi:pimeloyl-ACP methyl ester carboxylesterase
MKLRRRFIATPLAGIILATSSLGSAQTRTATPQTGYAPVNGLNLYYEIHGTGEPLILLHGGVAGIVIFGPNLPALSEKRKVIAVELQGHGRTADIDRPLSFEAMADDIAALMKYLGIERADVMGYSLGGGVALQTAIRHPGSVRKLVVVSAPFKRDGWYPQVLAAMAQMGPSAAETMRQSPLNQAYPETAGVLIILVQDASIENPIHPDACHRCARAVHVEGVPIPDPEVKLPVPWGRTGSWLSDL